MPRIKGRKRKVSSSSSSSTTSNNTIPENLKKRKNTQGTTAIWDFYALDKRSGRAICVECGKSISRQSGSPTAMKTHLRNKHYTVWNRYQEKMKERNKEKVIFLKF
jgi:hypothetical protein